MANVRKAAIAVVSFTILIFEIKDLISTTIIAATIDYNEDSKECMGKVKKEKKKKKAKQSYFNLPLSSNVISGPN